MRRRFLTRRCPVPVSRRDRCLLLEVGVRLDNQIAHPILNAGVADWAQQREATTLAIDRVLACREGDIAPAATAALPDREADQLEAGQRPVGEMELRVGQLARRVRLVVWCDLDSHESSIFAADRRRASRPCGT